jgi:chromosome segregation ATPase
MADFYRQQAEEDRRLTVQERKVLLKKINDDAQNGYSFDSIFKAKEESQKKKLDKSNERYNQLKLQCEELRDNNTRLEKRRDSLIKEIQTLSQEENIIFHRIGEVSKKLEFVRMRIDKYELARLKKERPEQFDKAFKRRGLIPKKNWPLWYTEEQSRIETYNDNPLYFNYRREYNREDRERLLTYYYKILWLDDLVPEWWIEALKIKLGIVE